MNNQNLIHIKLDYETALESKKDLLSSEMGILRISKVLKKYWEFRSLELSLKEKALKEVKEIKQDISKIHKIMPDLKIPKILQKEHEKELHLGNLKQRKAVQEKVKQKIDETDLEAQLREIKEKLRVLQS